MLRNVLDSDLEPTFLGVRNFSLIQESRFLSAAIPNPANNAINFVRAMNNFVSIL